MLAIIDRSKNWGLKNNEYEVMMLYSLTVKNIHQIPHRATLEPKF
jgi:hypothetical protein